MIVVIIGVLIFLCFRGSRSCNRKQRKLLTKQKHHNSSGTIPLVSKEIAEVNKGLDDLNLTRSSEQTRSEIENDSAAGDEVDPKKKEAAEIRVEIGTMMMMRKSDVSVVEDPNIGWGRWYSMREVEVATRGFAQENVIGEGGYGVVYRGVLQDISEVAVKNLLNNKYVTCQRISLLFNTILIN